MPSHGGRRWARHPQQQQHRLQFVAAGLLVLGTSYFGGRCFCGAQLPSARREVVALAAVVQAQGLEVSTGQWLIVDGDTKAEDIAETLLKEVAELGIGQVSAITPQGVATAVKGIIEADSIARREGQDAHQALGFWIGKQKEAERNENRTDFLVRFLPPPKPFEKPKTRQQRELDTDGVPYLEATGNWKTHGKLCSALKIILQEHGVVKLRANSTQRIDKAVEAVRRTANFIRGDLDSLAGIQVPLDEPVLAAFPHYCTMRENVEWVELSLTRLPLKLG